MKEKKLTLTFILCTDSVETESEPAEWVPTSEKPSTGWTWSPPSTTTTWSWTTPSTTTDNNVLVEVVTEDEDAVEIEAGEGPPPPQSQGSCHGKMFLAHKTDCRKYYLCNFGMLSERTCPNGLHWHNDHCDWPENSKCKSRGISTIK